MKKNKFISVKTVTGSFHVLRIKKIISISPKDGRENKSEIKLKGINHLYFSTETPQEILNKISNNT